MKRLFILAILFISTAQLFSQKLDYYSRHVTKNGELQELTVPVLIGINLVMGSVTVKRGWS
ncbi:hypothetical protein OAA90_04720 [Salibacteraceae bacterium]|nr:hypothetical protein [Salibacteraceae bacterium]